MENSPNQPHSQEMPVMNAVVDQLGRQQMHGADGRFLSHQAVGETWQGMIDANQAALNQAYNSPASTKQEMWQLRHNVRWGIPSTVPESGRDAVVHSRLASLNLAGSNAETQSVRPAEAAPLPPSEVASFNTEKKGFFRRRIDSLRNLWHRGKETVAKTGEVMVGKPARIIGALAVEGAYLTVDVGREVAAWEKEQLDKVVASSIQADIDKADGYDENTRWGRLKAQVQRRPYNPRPKPVVEKLSREEQWRVDHRRRVDERLGLNRTS